MMTEPQILVNRFYTQNYAAIIDEAIARAASPTVNPSTGKTWQGDAELQTITFTGLQQWLRRMEKPPAAKPVETPAQLHKRFLASVTAHPHCHCCHHHHC